MGIYGELVKLLPDAEFVIYEPADCAVASWFEGAHNVSARRTPIPSEGRARKFIEGLRYWQSTLSAERFDIFEGFNLPLVTSPHGRNLLTIHDVRGLQSESGMLERLVFRPVLDRSLRAADHVITVSDAMKEELLALHPDLRVSVIYNGLDESRLSPVSSNDLMDFQEKFSVRDDFILAVGHIERRKNYPCLVDAVSRLHARGVTPSLVIIGNDSGERAAIEERVRAANLSGKVRIFSGLSDLEVRCAYQLCSLFVFPSSYEGFGIPILEAMAANRPMVLSDIPVFREITQGQGIYFPQADCDSLASAVERVLVSSDEQRRLVQYGQERVKAFGYKCLARKMQHVYEALM